MKIGKQTDSEADSAFRPVISGPSNKDRLYKKIALLSVVVVTVLIATSFGTYRILHARHRAQANIIASCVPKSSTVLLQQAATGLSPLSYDKLLPVVQKIQTIRCYDQNSDYLYVVVNFYISQSDVTNAAVYLHKLEVAYKPNVGFSGALGSSVVSVTSLKNQVNAIANTSKNMLNLQKGGVPL